MHKPIMKPKPDNDKDSTVELPMSQFSAMFPVVSTILEDILRQRAEDSGSPTTPKQTEKAKITGGALPVTAGKSAKAIARRRRKGPSS